MYNNYCNQLNCRKLKHKKEKLKQKKREREVDKDVFSLLKGMIYNR